MKSIRTPLAGLVVLVFTALPLTSTQANVIFFDDFNRANDTDVGNGWAEINDGSGDVAINNNTLRLRDSRPDKRIDAAASQLTLSTLGLTDINLVFDWKALVDSDPNDRLVVDYKIGSGSWLRLDTFALGDDPTYWHRDQSFNLVGAQDNSQIGIRFWINVSEDASGNREGVRIDNVSVTGVPEPGTLALVGLGLAGLGFSRKRTAS